MIIPTHCFSCGKPIGHLWFSYLEQIRANQKAKREGSKDSRTPEAQALDNLYLHRYCCRRMFLTQPENLVDMIRNRVEN